MYLLIFKGPLFYLLSCFISISRSKGSQGFIGFVSLGTLKDYVRHKDVSFFLLMINQGVINMGYLLLGFIVVPVIGIWIYIRNSEERNKESLRRQKAFREAWMNN